MSDTINLFMWGYQEHYRALVAFRAEQIFQSLDKNLEPEVFLLGFLQKQRLDRHPICLEPESCGFTPDKFNGVSQRVPHFQETDAEANMFHSHPLAQESLDKRIETRATIRAITEVLDGQGAEQEYVSFVSPPALVEDYNIFVVLRFRKAQWEDHFRLQTETDKTGRFSLTTSLLDGVVNRFLEACQLELFTPDPGRDFGRAIQNTEIIPKGAQELMKSVGFSLNRNPLDLFAACNIISSMRYEGAEGVGRMLLARKHHPNIQVDLMLLSPIRLSDFRAIRKLLEITDGEVALLSDTEYIYGLGVQTGTYSSDNEDLFIVSFTKHYHWELAHANDVMMQVAYETPRLPQRRIDEKKFRIDIPRIFPSASPQDVDILWQLVLCAIEQKHGTMVVISTEAKKEAERLSRQCIVIDPKQLSPKMMALVTSIDGSVLLDPQANCYAIGVILDGIASQNGTPARGARYNSAIRYMENRSQCLIIVISEDGSIDLIPNLRPQLPRTTINSLLISLRELGSQKVVDEKQFGKVLRSLEEIQFYLNKSQCDEVNHLRVNIEARIPKEPNVLYVVHYDLTPHPEFNEDYLID